jgi:hypothetical protein
VRSYLVQGFEELYWLMLNGSQTGEGDPNRVSQLSRPGEIGRVRLEFVIWVLLT